MAESGSNGMKIYDTFIFCNEIELAKLRIDLLYPHVDYICIVEGKQDFRGNPRTLQFDKVLMTLPDTRKIRYIDIHVPDFGNDDHAAGMREAYQSDQIEQLLWDAENNDLILYGSADEIPDPCKLNEIVYETEHHPVKLQQWLSYYAPNYRTHEWWYGTTAARSWQFNTIWQLRMYTIQHIPYIARGGWHMSYCGDDQFIAHKLETFCHADMVRQWNTEENIRNALATGSNLFGRDEHFTRVELDSTFPENIDKFTHLLKD